MAAFQGIVHVAGTDGVFRLEGDQFVSVGLSDEVTVARLRVTSAGLIGLGDWGWLAGAFRWHKLDGCRN